MLGELGELGRPGGGRGWKLSGCQDASWRGWKASISYLKILLVAFKGLHAIGLSSPQKAEVKSR